MRRTRDKEDLEKVTCSGSSCRIMRILAGLFIFVVGVVIGLISSSHVDHYITARAGLNAYRNNFIAAGPVSIDSNTIIQYSNCSTVQQPCEKVNCSGIGNIVQPRQLEHGLADDELLWRASLVPKIEKFPYHRVPKVAFMFLTRGPLPFLPLWERFFRGHRDQFSIYIHSLPGYYLNVSSESAFFDRQIPSQEVSWGSVSLADAERRLLANALLDFSNERFVLLSESCIPVYNFKTVYRYLINSAHSFVEAYDDPSRYGRGRYSRLMWPVIKLHHWRKGSQWFEVNRSLAISLISDSKYYALFRKYCKPSCYPDEHYFATFLNMFHSQENSNRTVTWVDWSLGGPHPAKFGKENITEGFIQSIRNNGTECAYNHGKTRVCYLFARKFAPSALEPLLSISLKVMQF
ncbi:hypothetical protein V2J09_011290 [Rumex salicifolius]